MSPDEYFGYTKRILARNILIARKCSGLNHKELVEISGITRPILSGIENESINPTLHTVLKVSKSLQIEIDLLLIDEDRFKKWQNLLKTEYDKAKFDQFELIITENLWKRLLEISEMKHRKSFRKIANYIREIVNFNFPDHDYILKKRMIFLAFLGFLFQEDGFMSGIEFGIWLALKL